jgi:photosystem II stability/assembly factor-like uncharacterized protein
MSFKIIFAALLLFVGFAVYSQNGSEYFKYVPEIKAGDPDWVKLMYSPDPDVEQVTTLYDEYYRTHKFVKNIHTQNYKHWLRNVQPLAGADGRIRPFEAEQRFEKLHYQKQKFSTAKTGGTTWISVGPFEVYHNDGSSKLRLTQANVYAITVAPSNHNVIYCVTESGGVFKSTDKAMHWQLISANENFRNGQDIKVHPSNPNIVYVATKKKIYKTVNGGLSWTQVYNGLGTVEQLLIHKNCPDTVLAATSTGLMKTVNGGQSWTNLFNKRCWDIVENPLNINTLYLSVHNSQARKAEVYKSLNFGNSWTLLDSNWYQPANLAQASDIGCKLGVTPADTNRIYAGLIGDSKTGDNGWIGIYYSADGGISWNNPDSIDGGPYVPGMDKNTNWYVAGYSNGYHQGWYNFDIDVSSVNPDKLWIGTIWACESDNKGKNIEYIRGTRNLEMHADVQDIDVVGNDIWYVSDGGVNYSNTEMQSVEVRNNGIHSGDYWGFGQGWNEDTWTGGRYHNGDAVFHENYGFGNVIFQGGAEKSTGYVNPLDNRHCYYSDISDKMTPDSISVSAVSVSSISLYPNESYSVLNSSELEFDPRYADVLYLGYDNKFYKSTDGGGTFSVLYTFPTSARVLEFEISPVNPDIIYVLVRNGYTGRVYRSNDGGNTFNVTTILPANNRSRLDLTLNPSDTGNLWVSTFYGANGQKVYETTDGGQTWINRTTSVLDGHRIRDILYQAGTGDLVYIATETGLFYWDGQLNNWVDYSNGLPFLTGALKMAPFYRDGKLRLASSRGIWEAPLAKPSTLSAQPVVKHRKYYCSRDTVMLDDHSVLNHSGASWSWSISPQPLWINSTNIRNPKLLVADGSYTVTLTITDSAGSTSSKTINNMFVMNDKCSPDSVPGLALKVSPKGYAAIPDLNLTQTNHFTITAWVKPDSIQPAYSAIVMNDGSSAGFNFRSGNKLAYHWPGGQWGWNSGLTVDTGKWSYVAMVVAPDSMTLYLNGVPAVHKTHMNPVDINAMKIGSYKGWPGRNMTGEIDEVCIWNRTLSTDEIRKLRHLTKPDTGAVANALVAYYQFNNQGITSVSDRISTHHAVLTGNAVKVVSEIPVGKGFSSLQKITAAGDYSFGKTGVDIMFSGFQSRAEVVATRINIPPNTKPVSSAYDDGYWILNAYGNPGFATIDTIKLSYFDNIPGGNASGIKLYDRAENSTDNWALKCSAQSYGTGSFVFENSCQILPQSQLYVTYLNTAGMGGANEETSFVLWPNPTGDKLTVKFDKPVESGVKINVYDVSLRLVKTKAVDSGAGTVILDFKDVVSGIYYVEVAGNSNTTIKKVVKK